MITSTVLDSKANPAEEQPTNFDLYDVVLDPKHLPSLHDSWPLEMCPQLLEKVYKCVRDYFVKQGKTDEEVVEMLNTTEVDLPFDLVNELGILISQKKRIVVVGNFKRGKSLLVNLLTGKMFVSCQTIATRGASISVCAHATFIDSSGYQTSLATDAIENAKRDIQSQYKVPELDEESKRNRTLYTQWTKKRDEKKQQLQQHAKSIAMINKQASETFLHDLLFEMADVIIVVVNEMTFSEHVYIYSMLKNIKEYNKKQTRDDNAFSKFPTLIVVHNFRTTTTKKQLEQLRDIHVLQQFVGNIKVQDVSIQGSSVKSSVWTYSSDENSILHVVLGQERTEAGNENSAVIEYLRNYMQTISNQNLDSILSKLCDVIPERLSKYFQQVDDVYMTWKNHCLNFKVSKPLAWVSDNVNFKDYAIQVTGSQSYDIRMCQHEFPDRMIVMIDAPGICSSNVSRHDSMNSQVKVLTKGKYLLISGERSLCLYKDAQCADLKECVIYASASKDKQSFDLNATWKVKERQYGKFERKIKVPFEYDIMKKHVRIEDGTIIITIPQRIGQEDASEKAA